MADVADVVSTAVAATIRASDLDLTRAGLEVLADAVRGFARCLADSRVDVGDLLRTEAILRTEAQARERAA
jgi:hypothetical protein